MSSLFHFYFFIPSQCILQKETKILPTQDLAYYQYLNNKNYNNKN